MEEMYEVSCKIRKGSTDYCVVPLHKQPWSSCSCCRFIPKIEYEYCRICVVSVVRACWNPQWCRCFGCSSCVCVFGCLVCMKLLMLSVIKLGCMRCPCGISENVFYFGLPPYLVCMKVLLLSVIKLGCKCCIDWKW